MELPRRRGPMKAPRKLRWVVTNVLVVAASVACVPGYRLEAASGGTIERATSRGITLTASVNSWSGSSRDLVGEVIPIWVRVRNQSSTSVRVRYEDFGAIDENGFRFGLVDPKTGRIIEAKSAEDRTRTHDEPAALSAGATPTLVFDTEGAWAEQEADVRFVDREALACEWEGRCATASLLPVWSDAAEFDIYPIDHRGMGSRGAGYTGSPRTGIGYGVYGGYYGAYGFPYYGYPGYYGYWGWGWPYYDRYYWPYYYAGNGRSGPRLPTTVTMVHVAIGEGELLPKSTTAGFIYLPGAARKAVRLDITWSVRSSADEPLAELRTRFESVRED